jgi:hypothetical protein
MRYSRFYTVQAVVGLMGLLAAGVSQGDSITLHASLSNTVQILALSTQGRYEIQLGGGNDQPAHDTFISGTAALLIGASSQNVFYKLSTDPMKQLEIQNTTKGGVKDTYGFVSGFDVLNFTFSSDAGFLNPLLIGAINHISATQNVPLNGNDHPGIFLSGNFGAPTGGSLASKYAAGTSNLVLNVGGNQRLIDLTPGNSFSGMNLNNGSVNLPPSVGTPPAITPLPSGFAFGTLLLLGMLGAKLVQSRVVSN